MTLTFTYFRMIALDPFIFSKNGQRNVVKCRFSFLRQTITLIFNVVVNFFCLICLNIDICDVLFVPTHTAIYLDLFGVMTHLNTF